MAKNNKGGKHPTRIFNEPEDLEKAWQAFKLDIEEQAKQWLKVEFVGKDGIKEEVPQKVPLTLEGFKRFCRENYGCAHQYFENKDNLYNDFVGVCSRVREEIRENQIVGGMLGFYNSSITQRLNGLVDKKVIETKEPRVFNIGKDKEE